MLPCAAINRLHCRPRFITSKQKQRYIAPDILMAIAAQGVSHSPFNMPRTQEGVIRAPVKYRQYQQKPLRPSAAVAMEPQ